jgi:hypothetical protein
VAHQPTLRPWRSRPWTSTGLHGVAPNSQCLPIGNAVAMSDPSDNSNNSVVPTFSVRDLYCWNTAIKQYSFLQLWMHFFALQTFPSLWAFPGEGSLISHQHFVNPALTETESTIHKEGSVCPWKGLSTTCKPVAELKLRDICGFHDYEHGNVVPWSLVKDTNVLEECAAPIFREE